MIFRFDASRPPPPIPAHVKTKNVSLKRSSSSDCDGKIIFIALYKHFSKIWNFQNINNVRHLAYTPST